MRSSEFSNESAFSEEQLNDRILVHVVCFNNEGTIALCLKSLLEQKGFSRPIKLLVTDNASTDNTTSILQAFVDDNVSVIYNKINAGFCQAHNIGFTKALEENYNFVFILNPDAIVKPDTLFTLLTSLRRDPRAGFATPKILRTSGDFSPLAIPIIDSAGMMITPNLRHFDRGSNERDFGQYENMQYVFGASGAACMYKREFLLDVALNARERRGNYGANILEVFDTAFFAYREDADLAFRSVWLGWKCLYIPSAVAYHVRRVLPENRSQLPEDLNAYSVRNRFLLQLNNYCPAVSLRSYPRVIWRNLVVRIAVLLHERTSAPALRSVAYLKRRALAHQASLRKRRRVTWSEIGAFIENSPNATLPLLPNQVPNNKAKKSEGQLTTSIADIIVVIVNFNSGNRLCDCISSIVQGLNVKGLERKSEIQIRVLAWDNASTDDSLEVAERQFKSHPACIFKKSRRNLGFAGAINAAYAEYAADAILILNPDISISVADIERLSRALDKYESLGAISPCLVNINGLPQIGFTARNFPTFGSLFCDMLGIKRLFPYNPWSESYYQTGNKILVSYLKRKGNALHPHLPFDQPFPVEQPAGAAMLVRKEAFDAISGFDTGFYPAWFEDVDFCKRLHEANWGTAILGSSQAIHEGGYSLKAIKPEEFADAWYANLRRYCAKHFGWSVRIMLSMALFLSLLLRSIQVLLMPTARVAFKQRLSLSKKMLFLAFRLF